MYAPDVPMCRPNDPDVPLVQFEGKTNLPGDWTPDYFMPVWEGRWKEDMAALRAIVEFQTAASADKSEVNDETGSAKGQTEKRIIAEVCPSWIGADCPQDLSDLLSFLLQRATWYHSFNVRPQEFSCRVC